MGQFNSSCGVGYLARYDCTPMRVYVAGILHTVAEICFANAGAFCVGVGILDIPPTLRQVGNSAGRLSMVLSRQTP